MNKAVTNYAHLNIINMTMRFNNCESLSSF